MGRLAGGSETVAEEPEPIWGGRWPRSFAILAASSGSLSSLTRTGGVIHVDLASAENSEWEEILLAVDAEIAAALTSQVVIHGGGRPTPTFREALQDSLAKIVTGLGIKVRTVHEADRET